MSQLQASLRIINIIHQAVGQHIAESQAYLRIVNIIHQAAGRHIAASHIVAQNYHYCLITVLQAYLRNINIIRQAVGRHIAASQTYLRIVNIIHQAAGRHLSNISELSTLSTEPQADTLLRHKRISFWTCNFVAHISVFNGNGPPPWPWTLPTHG